MKTAVVFGGAGFIGTHLVAALRASGDYARIVSVDMKPPAQRVDGVEYVQKDVRKRLELPGNLRDAEVYNLAAVHTTPGHEDWEYYWTNVLGAIHVCNFADTIGCSTLVFTSSISVYGPTEALLTEDDPLDPVSAYGRSKFQAEEIHRAWQTAQPGRKLTIVRPAVIFGAGEGGNFTRLAFLLKQGRFVYPGRDDTIKACGYVDELVRSMLFARDLNRGELTYNFAYPERYTIKQVCEAFHNVAGYGMPKLVMPLWIMLLGGLAFEILAALGYKTSINRARVMKLVRSTNIVPKRLGELGYNFETDLEAALMRWHENVGHGEFI